MTRRVSFFVMLMLTLGGASADAQSICADQELIKAINIIHEACTDVGGCNFYTLRELDERVDRASLLTALRSPYLYPVHLFFPEGKYQLTDIFDWRITKKAQLDTLASIPNPREAAVYIIGRASFTGDVATNRELSRRRMESVMSYLKRDLGVECAYFKGGWTGKEILQLNDSDARLLNLSPGDFRSDSKILNQAVHVFVFPCARSLLHTD